MKKKVALINKGAAYFPFQRKIEELNLKEIEFLNYMIQTEFDKRCLNSNDVDAYMTEQIKMKLLSVIHANYSSNTSFNLINSVAYIEEMKEALDAVSKKLTDMFKED